MTATALRGHIQAPPGRASGDAEFMAACERRAYVLLQEALAGMTTGEAVAHLADLFPDRSARWFRRNLHALRSLPPDGLGRVLTYADPTGETATRHLDERRSTHV